MQELIKKKKRDLRHFGINTSKIDFSKIRSPIELDNLCKRLIQKRLDLEIKIDLIKADVTKQKLKPIIPKPQPKPKQQKPKPKVVKKNKVNRKPIIPKRRDEIIRYVGLGYTVPVICDIMDMYPQNVYSTMSRHRKQLRENAQEVN
jgi:hypothetical protein